MARRRSAVPVIAVMIALTFCSVSESQSANPAGGSPLAIARQKELASRGRPAPLAVSKLEFRPGWLFFKSDGLRPDTLSVGPPLYEYKFDGDGAWRSLHYGEPFRFDRAAPGAYRVLIRAVSTDPSRENQAAVLELLVPAPVWRSWWVLAAVGLGMASLALAGHRWRMH